MFVSLLLPPLFSLYATIILAAPAPQSAPCVPRYTIPGAGGLSAQYQSIPLGPGESYCEGSSPSGTDSGASSVSVPASASSASSSRQYKVSCRDNDKDGKSEENEKGSGTNTTDSEPSASHTTAAVASASSGSTSTESQPNSGSTNTTNPGTSSPSDNTAGTSGSTFQATITGYGPNCASRGSGYGSCGFLGTPSSFQGAVSTYWNSAGLPGQCGTCWKLSAGRNINGDDSEGDLIGTPPIVVMVDNTCAKDPSKPGFQCNQNAQQPRDKFGSVTVVDLCHDTGAPEAFWGKTFAPGQTGGLAVANISQVDCTEWQGSLNRFADWSGWELERGSQKQVVKKGGA